MIRFFDAIKGSKVTVALLLHFKPLMACHFALPGRPWNYDKTSIQNGRVWNGQKHEVTGCALQAM